jgi:hypothetical protein
MLSLQDAEHPELQAVKEDTSSKVLETLEQCLKQAEPSAIIIFCGAEEHVLYAETDPNNSPDPAVADYVSNIDKVRVHCRWSFLRRTRLRSAFNARPELRRSQMIAEAAKANAKPGEWPW